jgi:hypothetical protein
MTSLVVTKKNTHTDSQQQNAQLCTLSLSALCHDFSPLKTVSDSDMHVDHLVYQTTIKNSLSLLELYNLTVMGIFDLNDAEVRSATGLTREVFFYIYTTYCGAHTIINSPSKLYELFVYFKTYPIHRTFRVSFGRNNKYTCRFLQRLQERARYLAAGR